ncbi:hypothetical protein TNCV_484721, partial [Trichonephila clavipes]
MRSLAPAPVLSGGPRRKTQLSPVPSTWSPSTPDPPHQSRSSEVQNPAPSASVPRGQSVVSSFQKVKNHQEHNFIPLSPGLATGTLSLAEKIKI